MQTTSRLFDDLAKIMTTAAGAAQGAAREVESLMRAQMERMRAEWDLVPREEIEAVKAVAQAARTEGEALSKRVAELEAALVTRDRKATAADKRRAPANKPAAPQRAPRGPRPKARKRP